MLSEHTWEENLDLVASSKTVSEFFISPVDMEMLKDKLFGIIQQL
jgi:hypothetical protein